MSDNPTDSRKSNVSRQPSRRRQGSSGDGLEAVAAMHAAAATVPPRPSTPDAYTEALEQSLDALASALLSARHGERHTRLVEAHMPPPARRAVCAFNDWAAAVHISQPQASVEVLRRQVTWQSREVARIIKQVANGNLSSRMLLTMDDQALQGEALELAQAVNQLVERLSAVTSEITRIAREVGTEGKLGSQAQVAGISGTWKDLTDSVNMLAGNLTSQVRNIALVTTAVAHGDLSQKITADAHGEVLHLKVTINTMVDQLRAFAAEVIRVAREVGTEGKLGGQAEVPGVSGTWKDLTDNVNLMASNLTNQVRGIVKVVTAVATGDLSQRFVVEARGEIAALADTINNMTHTLRVFADQVTTVARRVGIEGQLGGQASVPGAAGIWRDLTDNVNMLAGNLTSQVRNIAVVTTAVANGDLSRKITVAAEGEILELKDTINTMVEKLRTFASEVTRVAREVGTEGKLGGQAQVPGVAGTWKDLTESVNLMASNLTSQVRGIVKVVTAVANGDLNKKFIVESKGEIAALADTINDMTDTLRTFAQQVTGVAREVGIEGRLGGQAKVPGAFGTWRDLTDNVNQLAGNLTTQVRAISEVANAVTAGDLTRTIDVGAQGEVLSLKDTINQMIANLCDTTQANNEQDWLKTNLAKFAQMMQGQRSLESLAQLVISELTPLVRGQVGTFFIAEEGRQKRPSCLRLLSSYAHRSTEAHEETMAFGVGLAGQCAVEKKLIVVDAVPANYLAIQSSLGTAPPRYILLLPIIFEGRIKGVIELASFECFRPIHITFLEQLSLSIGVVLNMISASARTEELLVELKGSNVELEKRTNELEEKASLLEGKNREIAEASASLEEKAKQLALVSKYKSEFLANMSHELRTPLNSLLILAKLLADNDDGTLQERQVEYARTIFSAGNDLLALISQILDLSKIEAGKMIIEKQPVQIADICDYVEHSFRQIGRQRSIEFTAVIEPGCPPQLTTDTHRLQQILKNLLSNAFKFTDKGEVRLSIGTAGAADVGLPTFHMSSLLRAPRILALAVTDTGIGIAAAKQQLIFEAFQQADASTSRTYGGTGLGLTISRELSRLLGGELRLQSVPNEGSTFTLYLPLLRCDLNSSAEAREVARLPHNPMQPSEGPLPARLLGAMAPTVSPEELVGRRILLVDDDVRNLFAVTCLLERAGMQVMPARSAHEALTRLRDQDGVDLVLLDIMMPEMDGYQATHAIRAMPTCRHLPVVALTAKAMPGDREKCLAAGCTDFVAKPVQPELLFSTMARALRGGHGGN